jgi:DNA polymerase-1
MPNIRATFIPDTGKIIFDIDLDRADLQVVVWEADDADLKRQLRLGVDLHIMNGILLAGKEPPSEEELIEDHPNYPEHKARYKTERQLAKNFVHGTNYGGKEKTMAAVCGINVADCARLQKRWFDLHPGIKRWHDRIERELQTRRYITNPFGYRRYYFDRIDGVLPEALAWIPQSTVANVTARMQHNIERADIGVDILIQVHDSLVGQYSAASESWILPSLHKACLIEIPYREPLVIPVGLKTSNKSWGDCREKAWPAADLLIG